VKFAEYKRAFWWCNQLAQIKLINPFTVKHNISKLMQCEGFFLYQTVFANARQEDNGDFMK